MMTISPIECREARALFAMSRQELANASGVSLRTISSFEDTTDRLPTAANLAAIQLALEQLGAVFWGGNVKWRPPFSDSQTRVILELQVRNGPHMITAAQLIAKTRCSRFDLETLSRLQILTGMDGYPMLTAIGLHMPGLLRNHETRKIAERETSAPINYDVHLDDRIVFHVRTGAVYRIEEDETLSTLFDQSVEEDLRTIVMVGAREALRMYRERYSRGVGPFGWLTSH